MKVKDLLTINVTGVDVYENVADAVGVAFEWDQTTHLTPAGEKYFQKALNYKVESISNGMIILDTENTVSAEEIAKHDFEESFPEATQNVIGFFWAVAGYISQEDYDKYFETIL